MVLGPCMTVRHAPEYPMEHPSLGPQKRRRNHAFPIATGSKERKLWALAFLGGKLHAPLSMLLPPSTPHPSEKTLDCAEGRWTMQRSCKCSSPTMTQATKKAQALPRGRSSRKTCPGGHRTDMEEKHQKSQDLQLVTSLESLFVTLCRPVRDLILGYQVRSRTEGPGG